MTPLRSFEDFIREGVVNKKRTDLSRANSLIEEAEKRFNFLKEMLTKIKVNDENANYYVENSYDIILELIRAKLLIDGFKTTGISAHEAEVSYLRNLGFTETETRFVNELRYFRNRIIYYGKSLDAEYARSVLTFLDQTYLKLKKLLIDL